MSSTRKIAEALCGISDQEDRNKPSMIARVKSALMSMRDTAGVERLRDVLSRSRVIQVAAGRLSSMWNQSSEISSDDNKAAGWTGLESSKGGSSTRPGN